MALPYDTELYLRKTLNDLGISTSENNLNYQQDSFNGDGVTTVFNLSHVPSSRSPVIVAYYPYNVLGSGLQFFKNPEDFSIVGSIHLTFVNPPVLNFSILVIYEY